MENERVRIADIAEELGLSTATPYRLSHETIRRIIHKLL